MSRGASVIDRWRSGYLRNDASCTIKDPRNGQWLRKHFPPRDRILLQNCGYAVRKTGREEMYGQTGKIPTDLEAI